MSDGNLLIFGCAVLFVALAGAYVFLRERLAEHSENEVGAPAPERSPRALPEVV
jgi:hypothetical protein